MLEKSAWGCVLSGACNPIVLLGDFSTTEVILLAQSLSLLRLIRVIVMKIVRLEQQLGCALELNQAWNSKAALRRKRNPI